MFTLNDHLTIGPMVTARIPEGFELRPYKIIRLSPLSPTIGAEVTGVGLGDDFDPEVHDEVRQALLEWKVLFFRDQDIDRDQQRRFAERWGDLERHPFYNYVHPDQDDEAVVRLAKDAQSSGVENEWHADLTWHLRPSYGAVLRAVEVPELGGDTLWADAGAAYDALPAKVRERIDGLTAVHDWQSTFGMAMPPEDMAGLTGQFPQVEHPVVRVHPETGRRTLFVNPYFTQYIKGLDHTESEDLLKLLYRQFTRPEFQCRFRWEPGSVAFWDNRSTQHYASSDYAPQRRVMDRISITGDEPYGPS
ncbi:MAG: TauD/TfdA family dioxygenase [Microthrixaceae bacterium]